MLEEVLPTYDLHATAHDAPLKKEKVKRLKSR